MRGVRGGSGKELGCERCERVEWQVARLAAGNIRLHCERAPHKWCPIQVMALIRFETEDH